MGQIIAGRFEQQDDAEQAVEAILGAGVGQEQVVSFYVSPAGQHSRHPLGGDRDESPGAEHTGPGRAAGMAGGGLIGGAIGAATSPVTGPIGPITGALVGAHIGSLFGSLEEMKEDGTGEGQNPIPIRHAGILVAVATPDANAEDQAIEVLRSLGAQDIERAQGTIANGDWEDFDPVAPPILIDRPKAV